MVGKIQLYGLNKENTEVRLLRKSFIECLKVAAEEYEDELKA